MLDQLIVFPILSQLVLFSLVVILLQRKAEKVFFHRGGAGDPCDRERHAILHCVKDRIGGAEENEQQFRLALSVKKSGGKLVLLARKFVVSFGLSGGGKNDDDGLTGIAKRA